MLPITNMPIKYNRTSAPGRSIEYIVVHDTGNYGVKANVDSHYNYFNGADRQASADLFVDDHKIGQFNPDLRQYYCWHCGDGKGAYGITNRNSIGIETCVNSDGNYAVAVQNTLELVLYLMKEFNIPFDKVVRHYDASRKNCPGAMSANNWQKWTEFKNRLATALKPVETVTPYRVRLTWQDTDSQKGAYNVLQSAIDICSQFDGYSVFDNLGKAVFTYHKPKPPIPYVVVFNNDIDKRMALYLSEFLNCEAVAGNSGYDFTKVETIYGVGAGTFPANAKVVKGYDRWDTVVAVMKVIGKI